MSITISQAQALAPNYNFNAGGGEPPKKYVKINGVMQLNPEYKKWKESQNQQATTVAHPDQALPVVSNMDEVMDYREASGENVALSHATDMTIEMMQDPFLYQQVGVSADQMVDGLGKVFAKHEVPMGLMNKLMCLSEYHEMEFMVDDSGSMNNWSDTRDAQGNWQTRWQEARARLREMVEVLAWVPTPKISVCFLNRTNRVEYTRQQEPPEQFIAQLNAQIDAAFASQPSGMTPAFARLKASFSGKEHQKVARYIFADGAPSGGKFEQQQITTFLLERQNPAGNPVTFLSCTNEDDQVEWMKEAEEIAPYCAEYDDFDDERREVEGDQGLCLPYSKGFHLVGQLVGAMNPEDLDAMDESIPFTKFMLDNLLGMQTDANQYKRYYDGFCDAQKGKSGNSYMDQFKKNMNWKQHYSSFATGTMASDIQVVKTFKAGLLEAAKKDKKT